MGQSVMQGDWFATFKVKVTVGAHTIRYDCFIISTELLIFFQPNQFKRYIIISWNVLCINWIAVLKVTVTVKVQNFIESLCSLYVLLLLTITDPVQESGHILTVSFLGSPSRGGDVTVYGWHKSTELAHSFVLFCSCVRFCLNGFSTIFYSINFSRQLAVFSLCSSGLISALLVLSTIYISLWKSPSALI